MIVNDFFRITVSQTSPTASAPIINTWDFRLLSTDNPLILSLHGPELVDSFITRYYQPLGAAISNQTPITGVTVRAYSHPEDGYDQLTGYAIGTNTAALMPPANTLAIRLVRTNFSMRNGRKAFAGATTNALSNTGGIATTTATLFATVTEGWQTTDWVPEITGVDAVIGDVVVRVPTTPDTNPTVFSTNITYGAVYWGTQNSRK